MERERDLNRNSDEDRSSGDSFRAQRVIWFFNYNRRHRPVHVEVHGTANHDGDATVNGVLIDAAYR